MLAVMGLIGWPGRVRADRLRFAGHDLLRMSPRQRRRLIGKDMAMVFQEPTIFAQSRAIRSAGRSPKACARTMRWNGAQCAGR